MTRPPVEAPTSGRQQAHSGRHFSLKFWLRSADWARGARLATRLHSLQRFKGKLCLCFLSFQWAHANQQVALLFES